MFQAVYLSVLVCISGPQLHLPLCYKKPSCCAFPYCYFYQHSNAYFSSFFLGSLLQAEEVTSCKQQYLLLRASLAYWDFNVQRFRKRWDRSTDPEMWKGKEGKRSLLFVFFFPFFSVRVLSLTSRARSILNKKTELFIWFSDTKVGLSLVSVSTHIFMESLYNLYSYSICYTHIYIVMQLSYDMHIISQAVKMLWISNAQYLCCAEKWKNPHNRHCSGVPEPVCSECRTPYSQSFWPGL